jgi:hypothetical protein
MSGPRVEGDVVDAVGTRLLHEDERLKIWELSLEPGEQTAPHEHLLDHVIVILEGDRIAAVPHARSTGRSADYIEAEVQPGAWYVQKKGGLEAARNVGKARYREILIELKD